MEPKMNMRTTNISVQYASWNDYLVIELNLGTIYLPNEL